MRIDLKGRQWFKGLVVRSLAVKPGVFVPGFLALLAMAALALAVAGCAGSGSGGATGAGTKGDPSAQTQKVPVDGGGSYTDVSASGLSSMLKAKDFPLINVHIPYEGEIEGTDAFIPYNEIEANVSKLPQDKSAKLVLYCRSGSMSAIAARTLVKLGYTNVWNLDGGMIGWKQAGYAVAEKKR